MTRAFITTLSAVLYLVVAAGATTASAEEGVTSQAALAPFQACLAVADPIPLDQLGREAVALPGGDHFWLQSSTHLQGLRATEKWVGGLLYMPPADTLFDGFTSAVIVNNPDDSAATLVEIDYFSHMGVLLSTSTPALILPGGHHIEAAMPIAASGVGSARVRVVSGPGIVGAALHHSETFAGVTDPDTALGGAVIAGLSSMEQLQKDQGKTELWWGPLPVTTATAWDFVNDERPFYWIVNPNDTVNTVQIDVTIYNQANGSVIGPVSFRTVDIPSNGTLWDVSGSHLTDLGGSLPGFLNRVDALYGGSPDWDLVVHAYSLDGLSILGDGVMMDLVADATGPTEPEFSQFRMASTMLANSPQWQLVNPDLSYEAGSNGVIQTLMGVANVGTTNAGPLRIQYFDRDGSVVSTGTVPSLLPNATVRIGPGSPGYPTATEIFGWVRISACRPSADLIGWSVREVLDTGNPHFHKAFGETLEGTNGAEPGNGFITATGDRRKVSPFVRVRGGSWPGYTTLVNDSVANLGAYTFSLFAPDDLGTGGTTAFPCGGITYEGLPWAYTSTTYEDPINTGCFPEPNMSLLIDHDLGTIKGIDVLGDPFSEYGIPGFAGEVEP
ncbi:MAG: hypothetical protein K0U98_01410 [Deltaproteobacteria bacterium]|nr:hypothetical protein [Deltaproteobacteria bacterium]